MPEDKSSVTKAVLLVNLGSPDSTSEGDVRVYLREFLMDSRVIDAPYLIRKLIVEAFILPKRPKESAHAYQSIWWEEGSPLIVLSQRLQKLLQEKVDAPVELAMRYGNPSIESTLQNLASAYPNLEDILLVPLYPHNDTATTETVIVEAQRVMKKDRLPQHLTILPPFYDHPDYIKALTESVRPYLEQDYDYLLLSYHGIPERHCKKTDPTKKHCLKVENCCSVPSPAHRTCYRRQVFRTSEEFAKALNLPPEKHSLSFQSRLGVDAWLKPATDEELIRLAESGVKKLLVMCPAFVADCLETLEEIGMRGKEDFLAAGGEEFEMIPCLNDHPLWTETLAKWCNDYLAGEKFEGFE